MGRLRTATVASDRPTSPLAWYLAALLSAEALALVGYYALTNATVSDVRYVLYPFVWINVGVLAVVWTRRPTGPRRARLLAGFVGAAYFLTLASVSGLVGLELGGHSHAVSGWQVSVSAPGWGPRIAYGGSLVTATFVPYRVVGYLALAYLVYAALLDAATSALSGVVGVASCVGCSLPVAGPFVAGLVGGTGLLAAAATLSVDLSTAAFLVAVALLSIPRGRGG